MNGKQFIDNYIASHYSEITGKAAIISAEYMIDYSVALEKVMEEYTDEAINEWEAGDHKTTFYT